MLPTEPQKVFIEVTDETDLDELTDRLIAALFGSEPTD
jgi:hypothetical protein